MGIWSNYCKYYKAPASNGNSAWCVYRGTTCWLSGSFKDASEYCDDFEERKGCFMTSACVDYMGKADDCVELQTMRKFRDEKLINNPKGMSLVKEYYCVAPLIVEAIDASDKKDIYYQDIYDTVCQCCERINNSEDEEAIKLYYKMFYKYRMMFEK